MAFFTDMSVPTDRRFVLIVALAVMILVVGILAMTSNLKALVPSFIQNWVERRKVSQNALVLWKESEGKATSGLVVPDTFSTISTLPCDKYTMSVEMIWYNTRIAPKADAPYRHILHRGSNELAPLSMAQTPTLGCGATSQFGALPAQGLPSRMNPGIFADPTTNDLVLFITTTRTTNPHEMIRVPDIPLDKPFKLTVVLQRNYVEVYINCHLEVTKVLASEPAVVPKTWYGLSGNANLMAQIQNLTLWKDALPAADIMTRCGSKIIFSAKRPTCPGIIAAVSTSTATRTASTADATSAITYGDSLSQCK
jgi:hypothetical protein